ncbi:AAA family ATPase [Desulfococcaceae bacterium HSG8]|nr:AAA family ATPase [Desulfococcaceae bacterium HSG8]
MTKTLPYALQKIEIDSFQCIKKICIRDLTNRTPWIFFVGENGVGKTVFLQALTIGVCGPKNAGNLLQGQEDCRISIHLLAQGKEKTNTVVWHEEIRAWSGVERPAYYCAYGPSRLEIQGDRSLGQEREDIDPENSLLDQRGNLRNIERWIKDEKLEENLNPKVSVRLGNVIRHLIRLMPNVSEIRLEGKRLLFREKGYWANINEIASGHKAILAMAGDILIRLFERQPEETEPENLRGIVVIDELDVHIHPVYQREFPKLLSRAFPLVQFICSTHSPIPLLGAPEDSRFFVVERDEVNGTEVRDVGVDVRRLHPNALLTSPLFNLESLFSESLKDYADIDPEDDYDKIRERRILEEKIEKASQTDNPIPKDWTEG